MLSRYALADPETARESVAAIEREAARMQVLIDGLFRLARGDEGLPLDRVETDLCQLATAAFESVQIGANPTLRWSLDVPNTLICTSADREAITRAISILLANAVKYTPAGGQVAVTARCTDDTAEVAVADTGIDAAHLPHIFDRFYRVDAARGTGGAGLGLAIARQITECHGGDITVTSELCKGSTFTLRLPTIGDEEPR